MISHINTAPLHGTLVCFSYCCLDSPQDRRDFSTDELLVTFEASTQPNEDIIVYVNITDDEINEAEEVFVLEIEILDAVDRSRIDVTRAVSLGRIADNDGKYHCLWMLLHF